jgi:EAL and modified HD-GYP domain-containing signal transduction protein
MSVTNLQSWAAGRPSRATPTSVPSEAVPVRQIGRYLTRQPLLDADFHVIGYELGVREHIPLPMPEGAATRRQARDTILLESVVDARYQQWLSRKFTLLELDRSMLDSPLLVRLPKENLILAIDAPTHDAEFLARCQAFARQGYTLALDERALAPGMEPLLRDSRYLRLDIANLSLSELCDRLSRIGGMHGTRLIARNVETEEAYMACRKLDFELYEGYYFARHTGAPRKSIDAKRLRVMNLVNLVAAEAESARIEAEFKLDPGLVYKLLRFINSPAVGLRYPVRSIAHALLMLGNEPLHRWLLLLLFAHHEGDGRQGALLRHALIRARLMESLGESTMQPGRAGGLFIVGILSVLDVLLGVSRVEAVAPLKIAPEIHDALVDDTGPHAPYLHLARACEEGDGDSLDACAQVLGLSPETVNEAHIAALAWAEGIDI